MTWAIHFFLYFATLNISTQLQSLLTQRALNLFNSGDYRAALILYEEVLSYNPTDTTAYFYEGLCYLNLGEHDRSIVPLYIASQSDAYRAKAFYFVANAKEASGARLDALSNLKRSLKADSSFAPARILFVQLLCATGQYQIAIKHVESSPNFDLLMVLGRRLIEQALCQDAVRIVQRAATIDSTSDAAQLLLAEAYWCSDSPDRACEIYHKMENKSGRFPRIMKKLAACYEQESNTRLALTMLKSYLIATGDASASVLSDIGRLYYGMSRFDSALVYFSRALRHDSTLANTYYNIGLAYYQLENYFAAERALRKAAELSTPGVDFYITQLSTLGAAYLNQNKHRQAIDVYQKVVKFNPDCIDCYYFLGTLYKKLLDNERAAYWYESFIKRAPKDEAFTSKIAQAEASLKLMGQITK